jgi:glycosyltransferase involved in cell wall biosynthesis
MNYFNRQDLPLVSIVLPVKNGSDYISDAIESLLSQTFSDFELIVIDDGSTDQTAQIVQGFSDARIRLISQENQGVSKASNRGFMMARGKYITRHDHDDLSLPERLEKQVQYLEGHSECHFVGTWAQIWEGDQPTSRIHCHPTKPGEIAFFLLFNSPFVHSSCLYRKEVFEDTHGYTSNDDRVPPEDYEYFSRISRSHVMANIPEPLVVYREVPNSMSSMLRSNQRAAKEKFIFNLARISSENLAYATGIKSINQCTNDFGSLIHHGIKESGEFGDIRAIKNLITQAGNNLMLRFNEPTLAKSLKERLHWVDYQYHTYCGNTYHYSRLHYLLKNRSFQENFGSIVRLVNKLFGRNIAC